FIDRSRDYAKLTVVASQMLGSMQKNITPTRAEVSDIANAVYDGADAIMLSEDILKGRYAFDAVGVAERIILDIVGESSSHQKEVRAMSELDGEMDVICSQAAKIAMTVKAKALVCITKTGNTAIRLSTLDTRLPIFAITFHDHCCQKLKLLRGVYGMMLHSQPNLDEVLPRVNELLKNSGALDKGDKYVFVTVTLSSMSQEASNLFTIQSIY
ncbi:MAG: pyruvate kinase, partial [Proteobacteria bacterium]|nr:pyruvate kinase [Pseudomonadota bacterium]